MQTELTKGVNWVGHTDWVVRDFHGYRTERGSSYNAYLVTAGQKNALIDTVKAPYVGRLLEHVAAQVPLARIDYVVCNHAEPDHAGGLAEVVLACPQAQVVCNRKCADTLGRYFDTRSWKFLIVADGEKLDLGGRTLQFFDTPMVHWPESMATFLVEDGILFSMDAFGQHYASAWRFDDEVPLDVVMAEAKTYYANIVLPYGRPVATTLDRLGGLPIRMVAPSHGVIWRSHFSRILAAYRDWMVSKPVAKVVILYCTMWDSTRKMAEAIAAGALQEAVDVHLIDVNATSDTEVVTEVMDCACLAVGSATLNMGIMPRMASMLTYLRGLRPAGKHGLAFGSHGWAAKGVEECARYLQATQVTPLCEPIACAYAPDAAMLARCRDAGVALATKARTLAAG
jgi:flavorubredoxin